MMVTNNNTRVRVPNQSSQNTNTDSPELYDASSSNPAGKDAADDSASMKGKILQCKNTIGSTRQYIVMADVFIDCYIFYSKESNYWLSFHKVNKFRGS